MNLKPITWTTQDQTHLAIVMGITLAVHLDKDGTYTASLSGVSNQRPEFQKLFETLEAAKDYAVNTLLQREIDKYFSCKVVEQRKPHGVYTSVWEAFKDGSRPDGYVLNVPLLDTSFASHDRTVDYLYSLGYQCVAIHQRKGDHSYDIILELDNDKP